jgi:AhpD family alkylhydroperoxidase
MKGQCMTTRVDIPKVAPESFRALLAVENYLNGTGLDPRLLALLKTRVSQIKGCALCLNMHREEARKQGETDLRLQRLEAWHESALYSASERAALAWAEALTDIAPHAPDAAYEEARAHFAEDEFANLSIAITMISGWNRMMIGSPAAHPSELPGH